MTNNLKRFDVVLVDFGYGHECEQQGIRPAIIIQNDTGNKYSSTTIVMPLTKNIKKNPDQPTHTLIHKDKDNRLLSDSILLGECMRQVSENRILKKLGTINKMEVKKEIKRVYDASFGEWVV